MAIVCKFCGVHRDKIAEPRACSGKVSPGGHEWTDNSVAVVVADRPGVARRVGKVGRERVVEGGFGFGSAIAMVLSFELNHSIFWMIVHGICSWFYVIYRAWQGNY